MTSDAQARAGTEDEMTTTDAVDPTTEPTTDAVSSDAVPTDAQGRGEPPRGPGDTPSADDVPPSRAGRLGVVLVVVLAALLAGLAGVAVWLLVTWDRPGESPITTDDYAEALQAARSGVVDLTSFDHLTLDDDIAEIGAITAGSLTEESVTRLEERRQEITDAGAVVSTEVIGAGVVAADDSTATVLMVIESTTRSNASEQSGITKFRIQVELTKPDDRWLLSGITGV